MDKGKILFADNNEAFLATRKEFLEEEGYKVLTASNPEEARAILKDTWLHVAIMNLRLVDDRDDRDISGLTLARETDSVIPKIVLTAYPTWEAVRKALGPAAEGLPAAVDFVAKQDGPEVMLSAIERAFDRYVKINNRLDIKFRDPFSFLGVVSALEKELSNNERILQQANEMEDLFLKLFPGYTRIILSAFSPGSEGVCTMHVRAISTKGINRFIVRCGSRRDIIAAIHQSDQRPIYPAETLHYAAVAYKMNTLQIIVDILPKAAKVAGFLGELVQLTRRVFAP